MPVDPVSRLPNYQITQSSEANDEDRRQETERRSGKSKNKSAKKQSTELFAAPEVNPKHATVDAELPSQIVDTEKVVELLSKVHATAPQKNHLPFNSVNKLKSEIQAQPAPRKINKAL